MLGTLTHPHPTISLTYAIHIKLAFLLETTKSTPWVLPVKDAIFSYEGSTGGKPSHQPPENSTKVKELLSGHCPGPCPIPASVLVSPCSVESSRESSSIEEYNCRINDSIAPVLRGLANPSARRRILENRKGRHAREDAVGPTMPSERKQL